MAFVFLVFSSFSVFIKRLGEMFNKMTLRAVIVLF